MTAPECCVAILELSKNKDNLYQVPAENIKKYGEIITPYETRQGMLNILPPDIWTSDIKIFEPCCGKAGFLLDIIDRFMRQEYNPKSKGPNRIANMKRRYRHIVEKNIYFADIQSENIEITKQLLTKAGSIIGSKNRSHGTLYKFNYYTGNLLGNQESVGGSKWFNNMKFDLIVCNPPYNANGQLKTGQTIYKTFIIKSLKEWAKKGGYSLFITPPQWRNNHLKKDNILKEILDDHEIVKIRMFNRIDGQRAFKTSIRYDYILLRAGGAIAGGTGSTTNIIDNTGKEWNIDLKKYNKEFKTGIPFIPNNNIELLIKNMYGYNIRDNTDTEQTKNGNLAMGNGLIVKGKIKQYVKDPSHKLYKKDYVETRKEPDEEFKIPYLERINKDSPDNVLYIREKDAKVGYNIPKIIYTWNTFNNCIIDTEGRYEVSINCIFIKLDIKDYKPAGTNNRHDAILAHKFVINPKYKKSLELESHLGRPINMLKWFKPEFIYNGMSE